MSAFVVNQSNANISVASGDDEIINGNFDVITADGAVTLAVNGFDDTINASYSALTVNDASGPWNTVSGSNNTISVPENSLLKVNGTGNVITDAGHGYVTLGGPSGSNVILSGHVLEITVPAAWHINFNGTQNNFYLGDHETGAITGDDDNLIGSHEHFVLTGCIVGGDEFVGDYDRAYIYGANSQLLLYGNHEVISCGVGTSMAVMSGTDDRFIGAGFAVEEFNVAGDPLSLWIGGNGAAGAYDSLTGGNLTAAIGAYSNVSMSGDDDTASVRYGSHVVFVGAGLNAHMSHTASLQITGTGAGASAPLDTITGAYCTLNVNTAANVALGLFQSTIEMGNGVTATMQRSYNTVVTYIGDTLDILWGQSNHITVGVNDLFTDGGSGTQFDITNNIGATTIKNFAADATGVINLLYGMAGITSAQGAASALVSDGAGGMTLNLGIYGTLDFAGDTALTAANFKIG